MTLTGSEHQRNSSKNPSNPSLTDAQSDALRAELALLLARAEMLLRLLRK
jgi:hypothetical protein